jgi:hypothetical protein
MNIDPVVILSAVVGALVSFAFAFGWVLVGQLIAWFLRQPLDEKGVWFVEMCIRFVAIAVILLVMQ